MKKSLSDLRQAFFVDKKMGYVNSCVRELLILSVVNNCILKKGCVTNSKIRT